MSAFLTILSSSEIDSANEIPASLILEILSVNGIDSDKLIVGLAVVLSVNDRDSADSMMSAPLEIPSSREIDSERKILTVPAKAMPISRDKASVSEISAALETPSVNEIDSDIGTLVIPALLALSVSAIVSDSVMLAFLTILSSNEIIS